MEAGTLAGRSRRRMHDAGAIVYEGSPRKGRYAFIVQFGTDSAGALLARRLWSDVRNAARIRVDGRPIDHTQAALRDALAAVADDRLAG
jgi:hypothetical protein